MKASLWRVFSGICGNIAAAWILLLFGSPFIATVTFLDLTRSLVFAIVFIALAVFFDQIKA